MSSPSEYYQRTPSRRSQRQNYHNPNSFLSFLEEQWEGDPKRHAMLAPRARTIRPQRPLYDNSPDGSIDGYWDDDQGRHAALARKETAVQQQTQFYDGALESPMYEVASHPVFEHVSFLHLVMTYMFQLSIVGIVVCFFAQTPISFPLLLLIFVAIPSLYFYITPEKSKLRGYTHAYEPEALYRGSPEPGAPPEPEPVADPSAVRRRIKRRSSIPPEPEPVAGPSAVRRGRMRRRSSIPPEPEPVAGPSAVRRGRMRRRSSMQPAPQPERTLSEATFDTASRIFWGLHAFALSVFHFEVTIELRHLLLLHVVRQLVDFAAIMRFHRDWAILFGGLVWMKVLKPVGEVLSAVILFGDSKKVAHGRNAGHKSRNEVPVITAPVATPTQVPFWQRW